MARTDLVDSLHRKDPADVVVKNARIVDVMSGTVGEGGIAVQDGLIMSVGEDADGRVGDRTEVVDAAGRIVTPGLIETHLHAYESNLNMTEFARVLLKRGTTTVPEAMYGGGQIRGIEAVRFFIEELRRTPLNVLVQVPVLGYLQNIELGLPPGPFSLTGDDLLEVVDWESCVGLEEPPYIPILEKDPYILRAIETALQRGQVVMGHGAGLTGDELSAYAGSGVTADHEALTAEEALMRIRAGMLVSMRHSDVAYNQEELQTAITQHGADPHWFMFCADVLDPVRAADVGHLDESIRVAIRGGIDPIDAIRMATITPARYYRVDHRLGSLAPGRQADFVTVNSLEAFDVQDVFVKGLAVVREGEVVASLKRPVYPAFLRNTVSLAREVRPDDLKVAAPDGAPRARVRVIGAETLVSDERQIELSVVDGAVAADTGLDVLKIAMFDRYGRSAEPAIGFLQGYGLQRGALGTTYNPMYHNVVVMGTDDRDMAVAANHLAQIGGGFVAVEDGEVVGQLPLALCGLMSEEPAERALGQLRDLYAAVEGLGCRMPSPFHNLAFTCVCGELPYLKLSHLGLFDVVKREVLPTVIGTA
jgi:adenine deaminase